MKSINEAIKQKHFNSAYEKVIVNIMYTNNWVHDLHKDVFKPYKLKTQHYNILRILQGSFPEPITPGKIKEVMLDKSPDLTRLIDKLVDMGYVERQLCSENRRKMDICISSKGSEVLAEIKTKQTIIDNTKNNNLTNEEANQLSDLLDKLRS